MAADGRNFKLYRYTTNSGGHFSLRVEKTVGDDADYGFAAFNAADPIMVRSARQYPRTVTLMDPDTFRTVRRPVGTVVADAWDDVPYTSDVAFPGKADAVTYQKVSRREERIIQPTQIVHNLAEPDDDAP